MLAFRSALADSEYLYGITEEAPEGENLQAQAPQAHEGESPQEAFALQVVTVSPLLLRKNDGALCAFAPVLTLRCVAQIATLAR